MRTEALPPDTKQQDFTVAWQNLRKAYLVDAMRESRGPIYQQAEQEDLYESAMDVARLCADAALHARGVPCRDWEEEYAKWLTIATQHALQAGVMGRDG